jgi:hypothetical protein
LTADGDRRRRCGRKPFDAGTGDADVEKTAFPVLQRWIASLVRVKKLEKLDADAVNRNYEY